MDAGRNAEALADLDRVASIHPDTAEVFVLRAELDLRQRAASSALLVYFKMRQWDKAIADYDRALRARPDLTLSLYGRGVARHAKGDRAGGDADIASATQGEPDIANVMTRLGVKPL